MKKFQSRISLRRVLTLSFAGLIIISGLSITIISYIGSRKLGLSMSETIMNENSDMVVQSIEHYLSSAYKINHILAFDIKANGMDKALLDKFYNYLTINTHISGIYLGLEEGTFLQAKRMGDGSISFREIKNNGSSIKSNWRHENSNYYLSGYNNREDSIEKGFDPRNRGWYKEAKKTGQNSWSDIYIFSSDKLPGITNSQPIYNEYGKFTGVLGIDIGTINFSYYLNQMDIAKHSRIIVLNRERKIVAHSFTTRESRDKLKKMVTIDKCNDPIVKRSYESKGKFSYNRESFISKYSTYNLESIPKLEIGIIIPQKIILSPLYSTTRIIIITAILLILLATIIGLTLAKRISTPLAQISSSMLKVRKFQLDDKLHISSEFKEVQEIHNSFSNLKNGLKSFSKYVPSSVVAKLITIGKEAVLGGERRNITVFFSDIEGFTEISESMEPEQLVDELAVYLGKLSSIVQGNRGTVDKYIGDSIMSFWNAPEEVENHAYLACKVALDIENYLEEFKVNNPFSTFFPTRIGINTGDVLVGNIGSSERMNYTVMGDNINLGSRLESLNKYYGTKILISQETMKEAGDSFNYRPIDRVRVKGKSKPIMIYELCGFSKNLSEDRIKLNTLYEIGIDYYFNSNWNESLKFFHKCLQLDPLDSPTHRIIERIEDYIESPPSANWGGVYIYLDK